jgi:hypothetical protein
MQRENRVKAAQARAERRRIAESRGAERRRETGAQNKSLALKGSLGLSADELDSQDGHLLWPEALQATAFADVRSQLDALFIERALGPGQGSETGLQIQQVTNEFHKRLKAMIRELPTKDYIAGDKFLKKISYEIRYDGGSGQRRLVSQTGMSREH